MKIRAAMRSLLTRSAAGPACAAITGARPRAVMASPPAGEPRRGRGLGNLAYTEAGLFQPISGIKTETSAGAGDGDNPVRYPGRKEYGTNVGPMLKGYFVVMFAPDSGQSTGGFLVCDASDPRRPRLVRKIHEPRGRTAEFREPHAIGQATIGGRQHLAVPSTRGLRFEPPHWISCRARICDAFSDEGRAIYFRHVKQGLLDAGVDGLWTDGTEVEVGGAAHDPAQVEADIKRLGRDAMGDFTRYLNVCSLLTTRGADEGQRATSDKRVFTLTRSAWAGQQRYAALPWSGDTTASWATLRAQIAGGLNVAMAGLPYWTQDTGGFFVHMAGGERSPAWRELFARRHQFAVVNPIYRIHGTSIEREPYLFKTLDPPVYGSLLRAARLRYRLLPYLHVLACRSTHEGYTMMRALAMDFPDQAALCRVDDTDLFGPAFLVQPITRPMFHAEPPSVPGGLERFSARWRGQRVAAESGEHEIGVEGDDGLRLGLDDQLVVEDRAEGPARFKGTRVALRAGQAVRPRIDYFRNAGAAVRDRRVPALRARRLGRAAGPAGAVRERESRRAARDPRLPRRRRPFHPLRRRRRDLPRAAQDAALRRRPVDLRFDR